MCLQGHAPHHVVQCFYINSNIRSWDKRCGLLRPFCQLESGAGKDVPKARIFPFARVAKAIKIKVPDGQAARCFVRLDHGVGGAFDAPLYAQRAQQVAHQRGFAGAQIAVQGEKGIGQQRLRGQLAGKGGGIVLTVPSGLARAGGWRSGGAFYNRTMVICSSQLVPQIQQWARGLGFSQIRVAGVDLSGAEPGLMQWLEQGFHGEMHYMAAHGLKRARPAELVPGTVSVITARMNYLPRTAHSAHDAPSGWQALEFARLADPAQGAVSVYARGRDYHKVLRARLQKLSDRIAEEIGPLGHRVFTDSAPVLEAELAARSGQGWRGKHTLVLSRDAGSMFFLGEIYIDVALEPSEPVSAHCGSCQSCIDVCPTQAILAPHRLDARRCISYLTIEHAGAIPLELRPLIGNRIYGCDDCQLICPWNKYAQVSSLPDFDARAGLSGQQLVHLFAWDEATFLRQTEGGPIRRIGHERWLRNIAVALGNGLRTSASPALTLALRTALQTRAQHDSALVSEHVAWALAQE